ncbi:MAG: hypothetical protein HJJLKODD_01637 [Phycisphaerae bacterium]|nr:hypothetical protein [Phycisphaerae bacterium]
MNCTQARQQLNLHLDRELPAAQACELAEHLDCCLPCRQWFAAEEQAEQLLQARCCRAEAVSDWTTIERTITTPVIQPIRIYRRWWAWAAAAAVAFMVLASGRWSEPTLASEHPARWAVSELRNLCSCGDSFQVTTQPAEDINHLANQLLHCSVSLSDNEVQSDHRLAICQTQTRRCPSGRERLEIRATCCNAPVLLTLAQCTNLGELSPVDRSMQRKKCQRFDYVVEEEGLTYYVSARRVQEWMIVAVSTHPVHDLPDAIQLTSLVPATP